MGSNPCRIIPLSDFAHPIEGKIISGTGSVQEDGAH